MKKSCNWVSVVLGAIPDTYVASQLDIDNVASDTDFDDKRRHDCGDRKCLHRHDADSITSAHYIIDTALTRIITVTVSDWFRFRSWPNKELSSRASFI